MMKNEQENIRQKILIVDDSEMNRSILADMLGEEFDIIEAVNGVEAVAYMRSHEDDLALVLLDIVMPQMDGFEVLEVMNRSHWIDAVPVIMISAEMTPTFVDRAYDLGVTDYISRPFDGRIVRRRVMNTIMLYAKQKKLTNMVTEQIYEKEKNNSLMIEILSNIVEFRNGESGLHVLHIHTITELLLKRLVQRTDQYRLSRSDIALISNASALHDIGKIAVPESILNKPGRLTTEEFEVIKTHSAEGANMLERIPLRQEEPLIKVGYQICRWHHERFDGRGYPDGLKGDEIPIAAQVVSLADVYDALTSQRVYKPAYSHQQTMEMIMNGECGAFNPILLDCLQDVADHIEREIKQDSLSETAQLSIKHAAEEMIAKGELNASDRTLRLLEHERIKYQFFAAMSREVQFEYTVVPDMVVFSEWGAKHLGISEVIMNPWDSEELRRLSTREAIIDLHRRLLETTPEAPIIESNYLLSLDGQSRWYRLVARAMWSSEEEDHVEYIGAIGKFFDVHDEYERMSNLETLAAQDMLTGLLNHVSVKQRIEQRLEASAGETYALVLFDLDHFKLANDQHGHLFGDCVLKYVAQKVNGCLREGDLAARVGGDEFLLFVSGQDGFEEHVQLIFNALRDRYEDFQISISMGIALWPRDAAAYEALFHCADQALYASKRTGKSKYSFYEASMQGTLSSLSPIESDQLQLTDDV